MNEYKRKKVKKQRFVALLKQNTQFVFKDPQILQVFLRRVAAALSLHQDCKTVNTRFKVKNTQ